MKMFKKLTQNQLIGLVTAVFVVVLGVVLLTTKEAPTEEVSFDPEVAPPTLTIDTSYNATLSGEPFYIVTEDDEDMYDDSLDTCDEIGSNSDRIELQNRWYQVVAYEDDMTVEEVIFSQIELREGDKMIAVIYDAENQEFKAMPNKLILNTDGNNVEILEFDETLKRGTVIAVSANRDADFCADYDEVGLHENIENKWNLVSRPDFETVDYRAIWEVAFAKGGDSGVDPERYYSYTDPDDSVEVADLSTDLLYWVYGGEPGTVTDGGDLPEENNGGNNGDDEQGFVVEVNNSVTNPGQAGVRDVVSGETFEIDEEGTLGFAVGLKETPEEDVEMNFVLRVDGVVVTNGTNDVAKITSPGVDPANGRNFVADQSAEVLSYSLVSLDDLNDVSETVTVTVSDAAGELDPVTFNVKINDDEAITSACNQDLKYGVVLAVEDADGNSITDALVVVTDASGNEEERHPSVNAPAGTMYQLLPEKEGDYSITISKADFEPQGIDVTLVKDECHVQTQEITVVFEENGSGGSETADLRLALAGNVIYENQPLVVELPEGYAVSALCTTNGTCELTYNNDGVQKTESLIAITNQDGNVDLRLREGSSFVDFYEGSNVIKISGAEYTNGEDVPAFTGLFTVRNSELSLVENRITPDGSVQVALPDGLTVSGLCVNNGECEIEFVGQETYQFNGTGDRLNYSISDAGIIGFTLRDGDGAKRDFSEGLYYVRVNGAEYDNQLEVPSFEAQFIVRAE